MMRSMYASVSGLKVHQQMMDVIGNNISNINTIGYKGSRVTFQEMLTQTLKNAAAPGNGKGGINPQQIGLGVSTGSIDNNMSSGNLQPTGKKTDVAIQGDGFFIVSDGDTDMYTRNGSLTFDSNGYLVNSSNGFRVKGWLPVGEDEFDTSAEVTEIDLSTWLKGQPMSAKASENISYNGNLDASAVNEIILGSEKITVADINGNEIDINMTFSPEDEFNKWKFEFSPVDNNAYIENNTGYLTVSEDGIIEAIEDESGNDLSGATFNIKDPDLDSASSYLTGVEMSSYAALNTGDYTVTFNDENGSGFVNEAVLSGPVSATLTSATDFSSNGNYSIDLGGGETFEFTIGDTLPADGETNDFTVRDFSGLLTMASTNDDLTEDDFSLVSESNSGEKISVTYQKDAKRQISADVFDTVGEKHNIKFTVEKTDINKWVIKDDNVTIDDEEIADVFDGENPEIQFNSDGSVRDTGGEMPVITFQPANGAEQMTVNLDFSSLTQYSGEMTADFKSVDGYKEGYFQSLNIDSNGVISGSFDNGQNKMLAELAIAKFNNPSGLVRQGGLFRSSNNSGEAQIGGAGINGRGELAPSTLEMSNVDLAEQFTEMITAQRGFQANSKMISTSDQMLQDLVNLKR